MFTYLTINVSVSILHKYARTELHSQQDLLSLSAITSNTHRQRMVYN